MIRFQNSNPPPTPPWKGGEFNMSTPKISIIIPLYNQYKKLLQCLESIKNQTIISPHARGGDKEGVGVEIIIMNDGSTDISRQKIESTIQLSNYSTIQLFNQPNQGAPVARNNGFAKSSGEYIIFCDADIVMQPDMLEKMNQVLDENPDISYAYSSFKFGWKKFKLWDFDADRLRKIPYIHTTSLMRREHFLGFDPNLKRFHDWDLFLTMLEKGYIGKWINIVLFKVKAGGSISKWLPKFLARRNPEYAKAMDIVKHKHSL